MKMNEWEIAGHTLEYLDDIHTYLVDGVVVPSVTQLISDPGKYANVPPEVLEKARKRGTEIHEAIERYVKTGEGDPLINDFVLLQAQEGFDTIGSEIPVIIFRDEKPYAAGRLDLLISNESGIGIADIKTTSKLDKPYLLKQLNLYRKGFEQCYQMEITQLYAIHLRDGAKMVKIEMEDIL